MAPPDPDDGRLLTVRRSYPDPIDDVWAAFTDSARLARWFGTYTGTGRPGGTVELTITGEVDAGGAVADPVTVTIHECAAPHRLVVEVPEGADGQTWLLDVTLGPAGEGTDLVFRQRLIPGLDPADVEAGWSWYLDRLGASLHGTAMPDWSAYAPG
ncbi:SRPBCC domain-containing protein [Pseudonocardia kujensis]|uniref:SRPBCC domain-containing protein n=1 Tax=Pseudonocardia kujensis TaxID=1128675 RepID=UPI001E61BA61|nr:SRPBCC domain-containing protein [Pseudonocardia kujensis]MCE0761490.1 SRPBCC domain-containing protein [Pseudonocardia kujensis]